MSTIGRILKDMKEIKGKNFSNLYFGDLLRERENNIRDITNRVKENEKLLNNDINRDKHNNGDNNKLRNNYLYKSSIIWNNTKTARENSKIQPIENKEEHNNKYNNKINENNLNYDSNDFNQFKTRRFHRKTNTDMGNNFNKDISSLNNRNLYLYSNINSNNGTQINRRPNFNRVHNNQY